MADIDQQPTDNLSGHAATQKIIDLVRDARTCMFGTDLRGDSVDFCPMAIQTVEDDGSIWFISSTASEKNAAIHRDPRVLLTVQNDGDMAYVVVEGSARIHTDRATIDKHWTAMANNWFDGKDDPRISIISVHPTAGHYWESQSGKLVQMAKLMLGAISGGAIKDDGGVAGALKPQAAPAV